MLEIQEDHPMKNDLSIQNESNIYLSSILKDKKLSEIYVVATHSDFPINNRLYSAKEVKAAAESFLSPYAKPLIRNHDDYDEPLGRVVDTYYVTAAKWSSFLKIHGLVDAAFPEGATGALVVKVAISDNETLEKITDGRYKTVSIGFTVVSSACSVCGKPFFPVKDDADLCEHVPGQTYNGQVCCASVSGMQFRELSIVNVPADPFAQIVDPKLDKDSDENIHTQSQEVVISTNDVSEEKTEKIDVLQDVLTASEPIEILEDAVVEPGVDKDAATTLEEDTVMSQTEDQSRTVALETARKILIEQIAAVKNKLSVPCVAERLDHCDLDTLYVVWEEINDFSQIKTEKDVEQPSGPVLVYDATTDSVQVVMGDKTKCIASFSTDSEVEDAPQEPVVPDINEQSADPVPILDQDPKTPEVIQNVEAADSEDKEFTKETPVVSTPDVSRQQPVSRKKSIHALLGIKQ